MVNRTHRWQRLKQTNVNPLTLVENRAGHRCEGAQMRGEGVYILEVLMHHYRNQGCVQDICIPESAGLAVLILYYYMNI